MVLLFPLVMIQILSEFLPIDQFWYFIFLVHWLDSLLQFYLLIYIYIRLFANSSADFNIPHFPPSIPPSLSIPLVCMYTDIDRSFSYLGDMPTWAMQRYSIRIIMRKVTQSFLIITSHHGHNCWQRITLN